MVADAGRPRHRYDVRPLKIVDGTFHECTGNIVAVLSASYNQSKRTWYITGLCRQDLVEPGQVLEGEEFFN